MIRRWFLSRLAKQKKDENEAQQEAMRKAKSYQEHTPGPKKRTSIGNSIRSRPKNKHKRRNYKKYRGQGKRR